MYKWCIEEEAVIIVGGELAGGDEDRVEEWKGDP